MASNNKTTLVTSLKGLALAVMTLTATGAMAEHQAAAGKAQMLDYKDIFELEYAASPRLSPDGQTLIYERRSMDIMSDGTRTNLWQVDINGNNHKPLLSGKASYRMARFSPDGKRLAYISSVEGKSQLYVRWLDSGQTARITNLLQSPGDISWSPDGKWLAFSMFKKGKGTTLFKDMPEKPEGAKWAGKAKYIDSTIYRNDGAGYGKPGYSHLYVVPANGGTPREITGGDYHHNGTISWSADSEQLIFSANRHDDWEYRPLESDIYQVSVKDGSIKALTSRSGPDSRPVVNPKGDKIAYLSFEDTKMSSQNLDLYVMDKDGSNAVNLTETLDRNIQDLQWSTDGKGIYFSYDDHGLRRVSYVNMSGKRRELDIELGGLFLGRPYTSGNFRAGKNGALVYTKGDSSRPSDLVFRKRQGHETVLTRLNEDLLGHKSLAEVQALTVKSSVDGRDIESWIALPPGFDAKKKYPLILEIHGGPHAAYGPNFAAELQLMAAKGYVVVWANPRGSTSYGKDFANLIHHDYPSKDYNDLMDVVDGVIDQGYIDEQELFVTGGSGGGVLTSWIVGKTDRFRAAVVVKPVINWLSFSLTADYYPYFSQYWMPGKPWEQVEHLWKHSPLSLVGNVKTPTMLMTGEQDYRTPMSETEQYYQALKLQKVDTAMVRIPKASHGIYARPSNFIQKVGHILAWFEKYRDADSKHSQE
ncbi:S9 family peptidase [Thalassomonas sp. RHCl1]|uniref:alpha/beta hydrolase family protein n=1 Tax=Thalassomonas sp. RHCl1 TaxID=2995320 RepID=UPI00248AFD4F|nr:S9 family peptidase [Thalassomonas sp. RHCl1]